MLQALRKSVGSIFVKVFLFGILILSFAVWGVEDMFRISLGEEVVAEVGDATISPQAYEQRWRQEMTRLRAQGLTDELALAIGLPEEVMNRMVRETLLAQEVDALGLTVSDAAIVQAIRADPAFRNETGAFDRLRFENILSFSGLTEAGYVAARRAEESRLMLMQAVTGGLAMPEALAEAVLAYAGERRVIEAFRMPDAAAPDIPAPDEATLRAWFEEVSESYRIPQTRAVSYVHMTAEAMAEEIAISEEELRAEYEASLPSFTTPATRTVSQMVFPDQGDALAAFDALRAGAEPATVAREAGVALVELGRLTEAEMIDPALAEAVFASPETGPRAPVEGLFGWTVPIVTEAAEESVRGFAEAGAEIRARLSAERAVDALFELTNAVESEIGGGASLDEAADRFALTLHRVDRLDANGRDETGAPIAGLPPGDNFLTVAFEEEPGFPSLLEEDAEGGFFILRVEEIFETRLPDFEEVAERARADWIAEERDAALYARAEELAAQAEAGAALADLAASLGTALIRTDPVTRDGQAGTVPLPLLADAFDTEEGAVRVSESPAGIHVLRVVEVLPPDPENRAVALANTQAFLAEALRETAGAEYQAALAERFAVETFPGLARRIADPLSQVN